MMTLFPSGAVTSAEVTPLELSRFGSQGCSVLGLSKSPGRQVPGGEVPPPASFLTGRPTHG